MELPQHLQAESMSESASTHRTAHTPKYKALAILEKIAAMHEQMSTTHGDTQRIIDSLRRGVDVSPLANNPYEGL